MPGQVMETPPLHHQQLPPMPPALMGMAPNCKHDHATTTTPAVVSDLSCLQPLPAASAGAGAAPGGGGVREQCPRCASHDTKFCYYNNYNTSQPRHFCRACRRYWTLGGSLRNVPIGGSTRKRPRMAPPPQARRPLVHFGVPPPPPPPPQQGLLGSLFALGAAPLLEGRVGFDLGLGLPGPAGHVAGGEVGLHGLGLRGGLTATTSAPLLWPSGFLENDHNAEPWKLPGAGAAAMWPEFSPAAVTTTAAPAGGLLHGGAHLL